MVFKKRTAPKRKMIQRKRMARHPRVVVNRALHPIPQRFITKMKYSEILSTDGNGQYRMNLNSIFDPNRTGTGHQPYAFDTLATLYNRYRVISCGWRIQTPTGASGNPLIIATLPSNDLSLTFVQTDEMLENPRCKWVINNPGAPINTLKGKQYLPKLMGRSKSQYMADDNYQAVVTTSPNELGLLYVQSFNGFSGASIGGISITVLLEYTVEFFDSKRIVQS